MRVRQWLWRLAAHAPLGVWALCFMAPIAFGAWTLRHANIVDLEPLQAQSARLTESVLELRQQLESLQERQSAKIRSETASQRFLELLLRHHCGISRGFETTNVGGRAGLVFNGSSMEALCALRVAGQFPGGVQLLRRDAQGNANFSWDGIQQ